MKTIAEIRSENLLALIKLHTTADRVAELSGVSPVYLSQLKNGTPDAKNGRPRTMGAVTARKLEAGCSKPIGWMDKQHSEEQRAIVYESARDQPGTTHSVTDVVTLPQRPAGYDLWTLAAIDIMQKLDMGQRQAMVARMREFQQFLDPPRFGQAL